MVMKLPVFLLTLSMVLFLGSAYSIAGQISPPPCEDQPFTPIDGFGNGPTAPCSPNQGGGQTPVCNATFLDIFQCSIDGDVERLFQNPDCTTTWFFDEDCPAGCTNGTCNPAPPTCQPGFLNNFRCSATGTGVEQEFQHMNCTTEWQGIETCSAGCTAGQCNVETSCTAGYLNQFQCSTEFLLHQLYQFSDCRTMWQNVLFCPFGCANNTCNTGPPVCDAHFLDNYQCRGNEVQRKYQFRSCETSFITIQHCPFGCDDGVCEAPSNQSACTEQFLNEFQCSGNFRQQRFREDDCSERWISVEACAAGCTDNQCNNVTAGRPTDGGGTGGSCAVEIHNLAFTNLITDKETGFVSADITNEGSQSGRVVVTLLSSDGLDAAETTFTLARGATRSIVFNYEFDPGQYVLTLEAESSCSGNTFNDLEVFDLEVIETGGRPPFTPPAPPVIDITSVEFRPSRLDIELLKSKAIAIAIESTQEQDFSIDVSGIPNEWLVFDPVVTVQGSDDVFVFVIPTATGSYTLDIDVEADDARFSHTVDLFVTRAQPVITGFSFLMLPEKLLVFLEGVIDEFFSSPLLIIVASVLLVVFVLLLAALRLREERMLGR